jgi:hypothetical protein
LRIRARRIGRHTTALAAVRAEIKRSATILLGFGMKLTEGRSICGRPLARGTYDPRASPLPRSSFLFSVRDTRVAQRTLGYESIEARTLKEFLRGH